MAHGEAVCDWSTYTLIWVVTITGPEFATVSTHRPASVENNPAEGFGQSRGNSPGLLHLVGSGAFGVYIRRWSGWRAAVYSLANLFAYDFAGRLPQ